MRSLTSLSAGKPLRSFLEQVSKGKHILKPDPTVSTEHVKVHDQTVLFPLVQEHMHRLHLPKPSVLRVTSSFKEGVSWTQSIQLGLFEVARGGTEYQRAIRVPSLADEFAQYREPLRQALLEAGYFHSTDDLNDSIVYPPEAVACRVMHNLVNDRAEHCPYRPLFSLWQLGVAPFMLENNVGLLRISTPVKHPKDFFADNPLQFVQ